jgi:hypothetical protein
VLTVFIVIIITVMLGVVSTSETTFYFHEATRRNIPKGSFFFSVGDTIPEVLKLWGAPPGVTLLDLPEGANCLNEGHLYFEQYMDAKQYIYLFIYLLAGTLLG